MKLNFPDVEIIHEEASLKTIAKDLQKGWEISKRQNFTKNKWVKGFMEGVQPFVIGLIISTGLLIIVQNIYVNFGDFTSAPSINVTAIIVTAIILATNFIYKLIKKKNLSAIPLILISAALGLIFF